MPEHVTQSPNQKGGGRCTKVPKIAASNSYEGYLSIQGIKPLTAREIYKHGSRGLQKENWASK